MKRKGIRPTVVMYSAPISSTENGQQWKLAFEVLEEMKAAGHGANLVGYNVAISALSKGQQWHKALELFREIESSGGGHNKRDHFNLTCVGYEHTSRC
jgi:pentatricopeptide repeat protein